MFVMRRRHRSFGIVPQPQRLGGTGGQHRGLLINPDDGGKREAPRITGNLLEPFVETGQAHRQGVLLGEARQHLGVIRAHHYLHIEAGRGCKKIAGSIRGAGD